MLSRQLRFLILTCGVGALFCALLYREHLLNLTLARPSSTTVSSDAVGAHDTPSIHMPFPQLDPVIFSLLAWGASSGAEASLLIKSILMYVTGPVELHIICDSEGKGSIEHVLNLLTMPAYDVTVRWYMPTWDQMLKRIEREGSVFTEHSAGIPGLMKLFLHELIPAKKAIFVDTDAIFISDPRHLWNVFNGLKPETAIVMSSHSDRGAPEWFNADKICSCVMLLDLEKLRNMRLMDSSVWHQDKLGPPAASFPAFKALFGEPAPDGRFHNAKLGDQMYWWAIVEYYKELYEPLSFDFEVTSCLVGMYETRLGDVDIDEQTETWRQGHVAGTPQHGHVVRPKLLHFNCLHGTDKWWEWAGWNNPDELLNQQWGPAVRYHSGFKWIWLNRGSAVLNTKPQLSIKTVDAVFEDERFAQDHGVHLG